MTSLSSDKRHTNLVNIVVRYAMSWCEAFAVDNNFDMALPTSIGTYLYFADNLYTIQSINIVNRGVNFF